MLTNRLSTPQLGAQAGAALMVESVQLCVVWGLLARAADEKQTSVLGGYVADVWCLLCVFRCFCASWLGCLALCQTCFAGPMCFTKPFTLLYSHLHFLLLQYTT